MAIRIGSAESYVVTDSTFKALLRNYNKNTQNNFVSSEEIKNLLAQTIYKTKNRIIYQNCHKRLLKEKPLNKNFFESSFL